MKKAEFRVGFVGVGRMGASMARRLKDQGYQVVSVHDVDQAKTRDLAKELDCEASGTPARVTELAFKDRAG